MQPKIHVTRSNVLMESESPINRVVPHFIGQSCVVMPDKKLFISYGLNNTDWIELSEVPEIDFSGLENDINQNAQNIDQNTQNIDQNTEDIQSLSTGLEGLRIDLGAQLGVVPIGQPTNIKVGQMWIQ